MPTIHSLNVYPVKSCRGIGLDEALVTEAGFLHDREWMFVRADGRFITQREEPRLALIAPALREQMLELNAPGMDTLVVDADARGTATEVTVWRDSVPAFDIGEPAAAWITRYLGTPARFVRFDPRHRRASNTSWTGGVEALNRFSDGYPWLVISRGSLDDLNSRLEQPLPMNRFRPNIVLDGVAAFAEDQIAELIVGAVHLRMVKPCTRCAITTTDQSTAERGKEPLRTLLKYRYSSELKGVLFGQNAILIAGAGASLRTGASVEIVWKDEKSKPAAAS